MHADSWLYRDYYLPKLGWREQAHVPDNCLYCQSAMSLLWKGHNQTQYEVWQYISLCQVCGWWCFSQSWEIDHEDDPEFDKSDHWIHCGYGYAVGTLKNMAPVDVRKPVEEVSRYLVAKNEALGYVSPRLVEDVVASAFKNIGYRVVQTPYVGDNGIDMYLFTSSGNHEVGVQVKRWNKKVSAEPIRSFLAL